MQLPTNLEHLKSFLATDHVRSWDKENFRWPGGTILLATFTYTVATYGAHHWETFRASGELVGAGGMFLGVVMIASMLARLSEWSEMVSPCSFDHMSSQLLLERFKRVASWGMPFLCFSGALAGFLAVAHVQTEHYDNSFPPLCPSAALLTANFLYVLCIRQYCLNCLREGRVLAIDTFELCLTHPLPPPTPIPPPQGARGSGPSGGPAT
jgi:hypothetical protein